MFNFRNNCCDPNSHCCLFPDCNKRVINHVIITGPTGTTGTTTATSFGSFYTIASQSVDNSSFPLTDTITSSGMTIDNTTDVVTLPNHMCV